ncbi:MAG: hypothetical protein ACFB6S_07665 [Geminicoccaceae bacterium]
MDTMLLNPSVHHPLEIVPPDEAEMIEQVIALQLEIMKSRQDPKKRGQHPKHQALLRGFFDVSDRVPDHLRSGVFAKPRRFHAVIRLSTGPAPKDCDPNPHGMAIKLIDVAGSPTRTQNFVMLDQPTFFIRDMAEYVTLFQAMVGGDAGQLDYFRTHRREFGLSQAFNVVIASQLERQYWSEVPIAMNGGAARLTVIPGVENVSGRGPATTSDGLRGALEDFFVEQGRAASFAFGAQAYVDQRTTPIEDATSVWPTPFEIIATLTIPAQDFTSAQQFTFGENLAFTPWHCVPEHRPLGGIQRCRKRVYEESARLRHTLNQVELREPTLADLGRLAPIT